MNKFAIIIVILLSAISQLLGVIQSDFSIKSDFKQWVLEKTTSESEFNGDTQEYELIINTTPYKLQLRDKIGNVLWTKTNLRASTDLAKFDYDDNKKAIVDYSKVSNGYKTETMSSDKVVDWKGNCLLMDGTYNRYVFVDKQGTEVFLPQNSAGMEYIGMFNDDYLVFYQYDFPDLDLTEDNEGVEGPIPPHKNYGIKFNSQNNYCVIFDKNGSSVKQFQLPNVGVADANDIYFDENMNYLAYNWLNFETAKEGYTLMSTTGEVYKVGEHSSSDIYVSFPAFSEDCKLWVPVTQHRDDIEILDSNTGESVFLLENVIGNQAAISNKEAGYLVYTWGESVSVLDYTNMKWIFNQQNLDAKFRDPWISGDGKEIRFTYQETGKPAEVRFYRMK
jgi:hypothetical protein